LIMSKETIEGLTSSFSHVVLSGMRGIVWYGSSEAQVLL